MKKYDIQQNGNNEIIIAFYFNKKTLIIPLIIFISTLALILFKIRPDVIADIFIALLLLISVLIYVLFEDYFEWNKNKYHKINIKDEDLYINNIFRSKLYKLKSVNIVNIHGQYNRGWRVYLDIFPISSQDYIIKNKLKEKDAHEIAEKISLFLNRNIKID
jgi:hypothetical protein